MADVSPDSARLEWRRHWKVVVPCFIGIMLISLHGHSLGVMIRPLEEEFGWPRAQISAGFLFISVLALLVGPIVGGFVDRMGPRRIGLYGLLIYCATLSMLSLANSSIWSWWGLWLVLAMGSMTILPVVWIALLNGYFFTSRGLAMAIALSGTGMGAAVWPIITNTLVDEFGWRTAYVMLAVVAVAVSFPIAFFLFREAPPREASVSPSGDRSQGSVQPGAPLADLAMPEAGEQIRSARFIKLAAASIIFAVASCALTNNIVPVLIGEGLTPGKAAATAGLLGVGSIIGRVVGGYLLDRLDGNKVAAFSVLLPLIPTTILLSTEQSHLWAGIACLVMGFSVGTELDCCAYLATRHFGTCNFGRLFGLINGLLLFGAGVAPTTANYVYDVTHTYDLVLVGLIPLFLITAILFLAMGNYRHLDPVTGRPALAPVPGA